MSGLLLALLAVAGTRPVDRVYGEAGTRPVDRVYGEAGTRPVDRVYGEAGTRPVDRVYGETTNAVPEAVVYDSETEQWNAGVDAYRKGDVTNAVRLIRPLMLTKSYGPRAAEVIAKLAYDAGDLEEAASAAQIALRAAPGDAKANRNFTRATDPLSRLREEKHVAAVLKGAQGKDPGTILQGSVYTARQLMKDLPGIATNRPERQIALADDYARRLRRMSDDWLPVRELIARSVTNAEQQATILGQLESAKAKTDDAAAKAGDLDANAYSSLADAEHDLTRFYKMTAMPPAAMHEDLLAQTNAWLDAETVNNRAWQDDALDWTRAFRAKFPAWARAYEQQAQADTNREPFTAEAQAKISALATELEKIQIACAAKLDPPQQKKALGLIDEILALLPKDKNGGGGPSQQSQKSQGSQDSRDKQNQDKQDQDKQDGQDKQDLGTQQDDPNEQKKDEKPAQEDEKKNEESAEDKEIDAILKKAQERNDEHEADKKARMRKIQRPPNARDW